MGGLESRAKQSVSAVAGFHSHHSSRTYNPGHPKIDPWMRDVLVSLQATLNTLASTQQEIAAQVDRNTTVLNQVIAHLNQRS